MINLQFFNEVTQITRTHADKVRGKFTPISRYRPMDSYTPNIRLFGVNQPQFKGAESGMSEPVKQPANLLSSLTRRLSCEHWQSIGQQSQDNGHIDNWL